LKLKFPFFVIFSCSCCNCFNFDEISSCYCAPASGAAAANGVRLGSMNHNCVGIGFGVGGGGLVWNDNFAPCYDEETFFC
jgi:hypothetical protein